MTSGICTDTGVVSQIDLLSAWTESQMAYAGQPGLSMGIVYDQELVWARGFGYADLERGVPATPRTLYRIASITKLFTATAVLQLRDAGKLQLDDPLTRHLPWFNIANRYPEAPPITIRHLITHTSGVPQEAAFPYSTDNIWPTIDQIRERLPRQETLLPTETEWKYSNLAFTLAGEVVATVAGEGYADYVQGHIVDRLGMSDTLVKSPDPNHPQLATGYGRRLPDGSRDRGYFTDSKGVTPAANMSTTVEDLARFAMLQFRDGPAGGEQILRGSTLREMQRIHWLEPNWQAGWGLGFRIERINGKTTIGHGGSLRGYRTLLRICPADKVAVIVLTNADDGNALIYVEKAFEWVAPAILRSVTPERGSAQADPSWYQYVGKYRDDWKDQQVLIMDGNLVLIDPSRADPISNLARLEPLAEHTFRIETQDGYSMNRELVVFEMDEAGQVQRVKIGDDHSYRVPEW